MELEWRDVRSYPAEYRRVCALYGRAFPPQEQMPLWLFRRRLRRENVRLYSLWDEKWIGMTYLLFDAKTIYLLYFAVEDGLRGKGYGSRILRDLQRLLPGRQVLVSVEPLDPAAENKIQREKRQSFYRRNGFLPTAFQVQEGAVVFDLLSSRPGFVPEDYLLPMRRFIGWPLRLVFRPAVFPSGARSGKA